MTKQEAIESMKNGMKVTHQYFTGDEWVASDKDGKFYNFEDGVICPAKEFWDYRTDNYWEIGWEEYKNVNK